MHRTLAWLWLLAGVSVSLWAGWVAASKAPGDDRLDSMCIGDLAIDLHRTRSTGLNHTDHSPLFAEKPRGCAIDVKEPHLPGELLLAARTVDKTRALFSSRLRHTREQALSLADTSLRAAGWRRTDRELSRATGRPFRFLRLYESMHGRLMVVAVSAGGSSSILVAAMEVRDAP